MPQVLADHALQPAEDRAQIHRLQRHEHRQGSAKAQPRARARWAIKGQQLRHLIVQWRHNGRILCNTGYGDKDNPCITPTGSGAKAWILGMKTENSPGINLIKLRKGAEAEISACFPIPSTGSLTRR